MHARDAVKIAIDMANMLTQSYLSDLTDADLLVRPVPGANHIAWQLGHLIAGEHGMVEAACPGTMPPLPAGFKEQHSGDTHKSDDPAKFLTKDAYLKLAAEQRAGTLQALAALTDADLDRPAPESLRSFMKTYGEVFSLQGTHWIMHHGQWSVIRRKLGKPPLF